MSRFAAQWSPFGDVLVHCQNHVACALFRESSVNEVEQVFFVLVSRHAAPAVGLGPCLKLRHLMQCSKDVSRRVMQWTKLVTWRSWQARLASGAHGPHGRVQWSQHLVRPLALHCTVGAKAASEFTVGVSCRDTPLPARGVALSAHEGSAKLSVDIVELIAPPSGVSTAPG